MPVEYTKKAPQATVVNTTSVREVKDGPIDRPTVQSYREEDVASAAPSPVFSALLAGEIANRGLGWYANAGHTQATRVALLKKTEQEILAHYQKEPK